ncbi:OmpA family protein [Photobacterium minamisatsumaniensis]|uniref:MotY family protein n=1 Tax=Photobacterium minamisatsumaniensis TaxID=2910233 RepID=UPI003D13F79D
MRANKSKKMLSLLIFLSTSVNAKSIQAPLDKIDWQFSGDRFSCKLTKSLKFDGSVTFLAQSVEPYSVLFSSSQRPYFIDEAKLDINTSPWNEKSASKYLLSGSARGSDRLTFTGTAELHYLLNKMEKGAWSQISVSYNQHQEKKVWDIPAVSFSTSYQQFKSCVAALLPIDYAHAKDNTFFFSSSESSLNGDQQLLLTQIAEYIRYDHTIKSVLIDGHTDVTGISLDNLWLSRQRAQSIADELVAMGVSKNQIQLRAHGQRYPLVSGSTTQANQQNRRVQLRIVKEGV